jgi:3-oxoacyl-(acyl-carrier-protein) synthase
VNPRRVVVTGMGVVSPVGNDCGTFFDSLLAARSGIRRLSASFAGRLTANVGGEAELSTGVSGCSLLALGRTVFHIRRHTALIDFAT